MPSQYTEVNRHTGEPKVRTREAAIQRLRELDVKEPERFLAAVDEEGWVDYKHSWWRTPRGRDFERLGRLDEQKGARAA